MHASPATVDGLCLYSPQIGARSWTLRDFADLFRLSDEDRDDLRSDPQTEVSCNIWAESGSHELLFARLPSSLAISFFGFDEKPSGQMKKKPLWTVWFSVSPGSCPDDPVYVIKNYQNFLSGIHLGYRDDRFSEDDVTALFDAVIEIIESDIWALRTPIEGEYRILPDKKSLAPAP